MEYDALMVNRYIMIIQAVLMMSLMSSHLSHEIWQGITNKIRSLRKNRTLMRQKRAQEKLQSYYEIDMRKFK
jgi:hypothetical protein